MLNLLIILFLFQDLLTHFFDFYFLNIVDELFVIICFFVLIYQLWRNKQQKFVYYTLLMLVFLFFMGLISSIKNQVSMNTVFSGAFLLLKGWIVFLAFATTKIKVNTEKILKTLKMLGYIVAMFAIIDFLIPYQFRNFLGTYSRLDYRYNFVSVQSIFSHASIYGWFMLLISLIYFAEYNIKASKISAIKCITFLFFAILSQRFKIMLACVPIFIYSMKKNKKFAIMGVSIVFFVFLIMGDYILEQLNLMLNRYIYIDYSKSARKALYLNAILIGVTCFPWGKGFGNFGSYLSKVNYSSVYYELGMSKIEGLTPYNPKWVMDTYWPMVLGELGFMALLALIAWNICLFKNMEKKLDKVKDTKNRIFILFSIYVLIQTLCDSLSIQIYNNSPQYIIIFIILGSVFNTDNNIDNKYKFKKFRFVF